MATPEATVPSLLHAHLATLVLDPALRIAWPEVAFEPEADEPYLEANFFPNIVARQFVANGEEYAHEGLYQVTVVSPRNVGEIAAHEAAGLVVAHFDDATALVSADPALTVRVTSKPSIAAPIRDAAYLRVPVTIRWRAFF